LWDEHQEALGEARAIAVKTAIPLEWFDQWVDDEVTLDEQKHSPEVRQGSRHQHDRERF
jgi:hypothetical protein